jgi:ATP-dependent RNA helicase DeaD
MTTFQGLGLPAFLTEALNTIHITVPTPIQSEAIPVALAGKDILASAQTGTGKTLAYVLPLLTKILSTPKESALILAPTREIATQVERNIRQVMGKAPGCHTALIIGGEPMGKQFFALKKNPRIIIGTPGRMNDHLSRGSINLQNFTQLVLDETDRMLDMGFSEDLDKIVSHLPKARQTLMFSATMPPVIVNLSKKYLFDPTYITVGSATEPTTQVTQETIHLSSSEKFPRLIEELNTRQGSVIIFVKTKRSADQLAEKLKKQDHEADAIHGDLKQRKRDQVINAFRNQKSRIMVATDIAARGIDVPHVKHVINYDLPQCPEDYVHRIGRTGRAGMEGFALSLISGDDEYQWKRIYRMMYSKDPKHASTTGAPMVPAKKRRPFQQNGKPALKTTSPFAKPFGQKSKRPEDGKRLAFFQGKGKGGGTRKGA